MNLRKITILLLITTALFVFTPAATAATCTNASLKGVYGVLASGLNGSLLPTTSVQTITFDGAGNYTASVTKSDDGTILIYTSSGTYQIAKNCSGTLVGPNQKGNEEHINFYLNNANKGAFAIQIDSPHVLTAVAVAQGKVICTAAGVKHTYSMQLTGTDLSIGQVAMVGQFVFNGTSSVSGTATLSLYGTIYNALPVTGTYQINSDCTGTAQITPQGLPTINLSLLIVNANKEIMTIETDANTIFSGTLQE